MKQKTYLYLMVTFMLWGSLFVVTQFVLGKIPTFTVAMFRYLSSFIALSVIARRKKKEMIERQDYKYFFVIGFIGYFLAVDFQLLGTKYAGSSTASLLNSMNPVFISVIAALILKEKLTKAKITGLLFSMAGIYLIIGHGTVVSPSGIAFSLAAVLGWAFMSVISRKISSKYSSLTITRYAMLIAAVCNIPVSLCEIHITCPVMEADLPALLGLLYMGLVCTAFANILWNKSLSRLPANTCSAFYPVQTLTSSLLGILLFREVLTFSFLAGTLLIITGVLISLLEIPPKKGKL